jgi:hypothetical protein
MSFEASLKTWLPAACPSVSGRISANAASQDVKTPYLVYQRISSPRGYTHDGPDGSVEARFQFSFCSEILAGAIAAAEELRLVLSGFKGTLGTHEVGHAFIDNEVDLYDPDTEIHQVIVDYLIGYIE